MRSVKKIERTCIFCGKTRSGKIISDDGYDFEGHMRGTPNSEEFIDKCSCSFGQLVNSMPQVKKMCLNCAFCKGLYCTNQKQITKVRQMIGHFDIEFGRLKINDFTKGCTEHKLNYQIVDELIKNKDKG